MSPNDDAHGLPSEETASLPLQFRVIRARELLSRDVVRATSIANSALRSLHTAQGSAKPISKIVDPGEDA